MDFRTTFHQHYSYVYKKSQGEKEEHHMAYLLCRREPGHLWHCRQESVSEVTPEKTSPGSWKFFGSVITHIPGKRCLAPGAPDLKGRKLHSVIQTPEGK